MFLVFRNHTYLPKLFLNSYFKWTFQSSPKEKSKSFDNVLFVYLCPYLHFFLFSCKIMSYCNSDKWMCVVCDLQPQK